MEKEGLNLTKKILRNHLVSGEMIMGEEIAINVDQALTQDATGTMVYLQFEAMNISKIKVPLTVSYVDHNMLQVGYLNPDDHKYLETASDKYGAYFSKPGNGICHQVNLERFSVPGNIMVGADSHTPTCGGASMLAIGVGGLDVAVAMARGTYYFKMPEVVGVKLTGKLKNWVTAKDIILEMLRRLTVRGGLGRIIEYYGTGIKHLSVPERSTICNMGAELGATTSIFCPDKRTKEYFKMQDRMKDYREVYPDKNAAYDVDMEIKLDKLEPMIACPGAPDNIKKVSEVEGIPVQQVIVGSCTNSTFKDLMVVSATLKGKKVHPQTSLAINPGSRQVLQNISKKRALDPILSAGGRINESACLGCVGIGQSPGSNWVSVRSFNRNWNGRSGVQNDKVYLTSPETCIATAIYGKITNPKKLGKYPKIVWPKKLFIDDSMIIKPSMRKVTIVRGPNIKALPVKKALTPSVNGEVLIKVPDNISTDAIMPGGAKIMALRSNIAAISNYVFTFFDPGFVKRAKAKKGGFIVAGSNYGQGSSREHAALAPMYLGVRAVFAKSFARIHKDNLVNFGILPLTFASQKDYAKIKLGDKIVLKDIKKQLEKGEPIITVKSKGKIIKVKCEITERQVDILLDGGLINHVKKKHN